MRSLIRAFTAASIGLLAPAACMASDVRSDQLTLGWTLEQPVLLASAIAAPSSVGASGDVDTSADPYPHISEIEKAILGGTFPKEGLPARLARMEAKAFGKPANSNDLADRTDALEMYCVQKLHVKFAGSDEEEIADDGVSPGGNATGGSPTQNAPAKRAAGSAETGSDYPRVTALEQAILEKTYPTQPIAERLARMETTAFGHTNESQILVDRTDALEDYADRKHLKKPPEENTQFDEQGNQQPRKTMSKANIASMIGNSLMGLAGSGIGAGGLGPGVGPAVGSGIGRTGFGGIRMRPKSEVAPDPRDEAEASNQPQEDPAVYETAPPPASAKLLTQVGWCEVRIFGRTSPHMHLPGRLEQLNRELNFEPGMTSVALMDHITDLMKAAEAHKPSVVSKPQSRTE